MGREKRPDLYPVENVVEIFRARAVYYEHIDPVRIRDLRRRELRRHPARAERRSRAGRILFGFRRHAVPTALTGPGVRARDGVT